MTDIKIEKNIPISSHGRYPLNEMEIGDSIFVSDKKTNFMNSVVSQFTKSKSGKGRKYTCRTVKDGVRVWRIA